MGLPAGLSRVDHSQCPRKSTKTNILSNVQLLNILEYDKWVSLLM